MEFERCGNDHGHFYKDGVLIIPPVMSVAGAVRLMTKDRNSFRGVDEYALLEEVRAAGLPERAPLDTETVDAFFDSVVVIFTL